MTLKFRLSLSSPRVSPVIWTASLEIPGIQTGRSILKLIGFGVLNGHTLGPFLQHFITSHERSIRLYASVGVAFTVFYGVAHRLRLCSLLTLNRYRFRFWIGTMNRPVSRLRRGWPISGTWGRVGLPPCICAGWSSWRNSSRRTVRRNVCRDGQRAARRGYSGAG